MTPLAILESTAPLVAPAIARPTALGVQTERLQAGVLLPDLALTTGLGIVFLIQVERGAIRLDQVTYERISKGIKQVVSGTATI
jgi:hypothetical protein